MSSETPGLRKKRTRAERTVFEPTKIELPDPQDAPTTCQVSGENQHVQELISLAHIGRVATLSGVVDQALDDTIWTLARMDHELGACITSQLGSNHNRFVVIEALIRLHEVDVKFIAELNSMSNRWKGLGEERNRIVHDPVVWNPDTEKMSVLRIVTRPQRPLKMELSELNTDVYHKVGNDIAKFYGDFTQFRERLFAALPTSP